jgi:hypothetical protein
MGSKAPTWSEVKKSLAAMPPPKLLALVKELFELSSDNRDFLIARFASVPESRSLKPYRARVKNPFFPGGGGFGDLDMRDARAAIREYEKATGDVKGTLDLMLTFVEAGNRFTRTYGDIDARFYDNVLSMLDRFAKRLISPEGRPLYPEFSDRLKDLYTTSRNFGWGYSDTVEEILAELEKAFEKAARNGNNTAV